MLITLTSHDWPALKPLLDANPLETIFLSSRIERFGLDANRLGCPVLGVMERGQLVAAVHFGANLMAVGDPDALDEVIERVGPRTRTQSILGSAVMVDRLYQGLLSRWGIGWAAVRDMRPHQPLMVWQRSWPLGAAPDARVRAMGEGDLESYFTAAVRMYTEEVGVSPLDPTNSYHGYVRYLVTNQRAFGAGDESGVWFKTDIGATYEHYCQIQGVWLEPSRRGAGLAESLMAGALALFNPHWSSVSLYVNDYNVRARAMYARLGFQQVGELATVLY